MATKITSSADIKTPGLIGIKLKAMIVAIAEYIGEIEVDIARDPESAETDCVGLEDINGQYILDRLETEDDAMDIIADLVRAQMTAAREAGESEPANASIVRGYENGGNFD